ncbi:DNA recombination protein RmuC [Hartmannibacter diazotrophicus]|uniref:DNA recombination protein RmuC homolog n=1 Tax=Hartmannibacter diazotrophicus TaxID=1482074 RepID=A0A2C9D071_9HYPH|nr:DNA recombination protein RmuC [Hartmannibacter diazotrophicus]SON53646.1 DNA recombination protein RmuC [Hartmannibacter diazotrophicus]
MTEFFERFSAIIARDPQMAAIVFGAVLAILMVALLMQRSRERRTAEVAEARMAELMRLQGEMAGRMQTIAEVFSTRQADLARALSERMDGLAHRVGGGMTESARMTAEQLARLNERMTTIDRAQARMSDLAGEVLELQNILSNKQLRGAFGQGRMEAIISDALPAGQFSFQATLSNGTRPDCLVHLPNDGPSLVIDAKFPLEAFERRRQAQDEDNRQAAGNQAKRDLAKHVADIRQRYFLPGETFETAFLFVPSESIFADIHEFFPDVVDRASRLRVLIVSPSLLMLSVQVVQAVLRDVRMKEQAHVIQSEVSQLMDDVARLRDRCLNLQKHFGQATGDLDQILISADKITRRGNRIDALGFEDAGDRPRAVFERATG